MTDTAIASSGSTRLRALLAAIVSFFLLAAGAVIAPPAHADGATVTAGVTSATSSGVSVQVQASGLPDVSGAYAALIVKGTESRLSGSGGYAAFAVPFPTVAAGATSFTLTASAGSLDRTKAYEVLVWQQHSNPDASTIYGRDDVAISTDQWDAVFGAEPTDPGTDPGETDPGTDPGEQTPASASISVFLADGTTPAAGASLKAGDKVVVKGEGYDPTANVGGRGVPIPANLPQGTYVVFGNFASSWQPSTGAASSNRSVGSQVWALSEGVLNQVPSQYQNAIRSQWVDIADDGTFSATLTLKDAAASPGSYGVYTYPAGGVSNADQERSVALNYAHTPVVTTAVTSATAKDGLTVTASGANLGAVTGAYVALIEAGTEADVTSGGGYLAMQYVQKVTNGAFTIDLTTAAGTLDRTKSYEVIAWQQHSFPNATTIYARGAVTISDAQWAALLDEDSAAVETKVKTATAKDGLTITATVSQLGGIKGAYVALVEAGTEADVTAGGGFLAMKYVQGVTLGAFSVDLTTAAKTLDRTKAYEVIVWQQHSLPAADTIYARSTVTITPAQWDRLLDVKVPETPTKPVTPPASVPGGSLRWAISSTFTNYVTSDIAKGAIDVSNGATRSGGQFQFGQTVGGDYDTATGLGSVAYRGSVRFTGHNGVLDVTIANPQIRITSAGSATLSVSSGGSQVAFATVDLSRAVRTTANGAVTYTAAPTALTDAGRDRVLSGYSTMLNPVTFTIGSVAAAPSGTTGTVAAAVVKAKHTLPATPPSAEGVVIDDENLAALESGQPATISAPGFQANEQGIKVVVYSTPVLLDTVAADADGVATWTGTLPASLEDGAHTLTLQGSVDRGLAFTLTRATTAIGACTVEGATLKWGYKESFRTYIEGIAKGGWALADVAYRYPDYVWESGTGSLDDKTLTGLIAFGGSITFTGHDGALNTTMAKARIELAGDTGYLVFDVTGTTQDGASVDRKGVRLAEFALGDAAVVDGVLSLDAIPTTLTEAGSAAFGTYAVGDALDPVTAVIPVDAECGTVVKEEPEAEASTAVTAVTTPADSDGTPVWPWIVGGLVVVALAAAGGVLIDRRSKKHETDEVATEI